MNQKYLLKVILSALTIGALTSCGSVKHSEMLMLQDVQNRIAAINNAPALKIQTDDILSIQVSSRNPETVTAFQLQKQGSEGSSGERALGQQEGYRVDESGKVYLPFIGEVQAAGKTVMELRQEISMKLIAFFPDATVQVRFLNFRVTLIGEVARPNAYIIPNEQLNILEAIGMAGDFTPYARRNSVMVMRERNHQREFVRVNTQDTTLFKSPVFYLKPNDIVYVEPLKAKQYATQGDFLSRYSPIFFPLVTLATFVLGLSVR
ncbi:MAG: polysaccharide biosynthesis/export family protein [Lewinellaceae bacterium]|nr:polysaccharide biosynthesis/export family protein [Saprospiraceae bacterium]MCB9305436.1 polysaccharide biosynthesis/export family protein [Lewinellaceae bacterium]